MVEAGSTPKKRLNRDDWAEAALAAMAEGGLNAVAVEPLAVRLGATKGSFYWHFGNREALLEAALARWEEVHTTAVNAEIESASGDPVERLRLLIKRAIGMAERDRIGVVLLAAADHPAIGPVLHRVTQSRLDLLNSLFLELGLPAERAKQRALLTYSAYLGHGQLAHSARAFLPADPSAQRAYLDHVIATLTTPDEP
ncbi:TetR/AcrR family transcriptional regulator [Spirillospora sp. NPDC048911]|uniref:TetR/AcrR family transcriptional regulator n=1 Tax=Spirillospora sp. NPDC048911 TaxID=3364527 RepID=UPI00371DA94A